MQLNGSTDALVYFTCTQVLALPHEEHVIDVFLYMERE